MSVQDRGPVRALDPLLDPFVGAPTDEAAGPLLSAVLAQAASPVIRDVVRRHVTSRDGTAGDGEDVEHTVLARLTQHLWRLRTGHDEPIGDLAAYAARAAANACHERLRARRPLRARLQAQLRYLFRHHATLALWPRQDGGWACGEAAWRERDSGRVLDWAAVSAWRGRIAVPAAGEAEATRVVRLAEAIVRTLGAPARLEDVVTLAADALGIVDDPVEPALTASGEFVLPRATAAIAPAAPADEQLDRQRFLERVWAEIRDLPVRQRTALLLNLTGPSSQDMLSLLPATGVASWGDIAVVLEMDAARLQALAVDLPHDDHAIANLLQVTRRQVINLRKCARERLARRLGFTRGARAGARP